MAFLSDWGGAAAMVKLVGNFLLISVAESLTEALALVEKGGFDVGATVDMLTRTLLPIPIFQTYGKMIAEQTVTPDQTGTPMKDLSLFKKTAQGAGAPSPISSVLLDLRRGPA